MLKIIDHSNFYTVTRAQIPMPKKTANDLIHTNQEFEKLKKGSTDRDETPRETPGGQGPGRRGYDKAIFESWTYEELVEHAERLGVTTDTQISREALVELLESRDATLARSSK